MKTALLSSFGRAMAVRLAGAGCLAMAATGLLSPLTAHAYTACIPGGSYTVVKTTGSPSQVHINSGPQFEDGPGPMSATFTSESTGSVKVQVSVSGSFDINSIIAGAQVTTTISLTGSYSWTYGNTITVNVPTGKYVVADYGAWMYRTYGHYYYLNSNCTVSNDKYVWTNVPENRSGWYVYYV